MVTAVAMSRAQATNDPSAWRPTFSAFSESRAGRMVGCAIPPVEAGTLLGAALWGALAGGCEAVLGGGPPIGRGLIALALPARAMLRATTQYIKVFTVCPPPGGILPRDWTSAPCFDSISRIEDPRVYTNFSFLSMLTCIFLLNILH